MRYQCISVLYSKGIYVRRIIPAGSPSGDLLAIGVFKWKLEVIRATAATHVTTSMSQYRSVSTNLIDYVLVISKYINNIYSLIIWKYKLW